MIPNTLEGELLRRKARSDYGTYVALANPGFYMSHFHRYLCDEIQRFLEAPCTNGAMDILLLSVPPQHGKSYTVTETLPSWFLAKHPTDAVIIAGYESSFAESFSRRNRDKFSTIAQEVFCSKLKTAVTYTTADLIRQCKALLSGRPYLEASAELQVSRPASLATAPSCS